MQLYISTLLGGAAVSAALAVSPVMAQSTTAGSHPVVQALPSADSKKLSAALTRLGRNARDFDALIEAGDAARGLNDTAAAIGFYKRADEVRPDDPRVKAGLASAYVHNNDPVSAIPLFVAAERAGARADQIAADRGLAYDLVGDNAAAQRYYAMALPVVSGNAADDLRNRLAVSQAISGNLDASYATLLPLLNKQDKPGWRTRAFTLAITGDTKQAVDVVGKILPQQLAENITPYLRYMPRLTKAQQAAAANLGRFPRASEIGRDDARIAAYAPPSPAAAGGGLIPKGQPLGSGTKSSLAMSDNGSRSRSGRARRAEPSGQAIAPVRTSAESADPDRVAPPEPKPAIERDTGELPPVGGATAAIAPTPRPASVSLPAPAATSSTAVVQQAVPTNTLARTTAPVPSQPRPSLTTAAPGFDLGRLGNGSTSAPAAPSTPPPAGPRPSASAQVSVPSTPPPVPGPGQRSLAEIFADIGKPVATATPASGAVDIRLITPAAPPRPKVELPQVAEPAIAAPVAAKAEATTKSAAAATTKTKARADADAKAKVELAKAEAAKAEAAKEKLKSKKPSHPSRMWVQIGVGRDKGAIAFDWRRYLRQSPALLKGRTPYVSDMGRTNRILVGPFPTAKAATAFLADAKKQGFADALPWTSPAGQVVDALSGD